MPGTVPRRKTFFLDQPARREVFASSGEYGHGEINCVGELGDGYFELFTLLELVSS